MFFFFFKLCYLALIFLFKKKVSTAMSRIFTNISKQELSGCSVQLLSRVRLFVTPWTAASQASLSTTNSWSLLKLMSIESVMPFNHLILCHPLLFLPSGSFPVNPRDGIFHQTVSRFSAANHIFLSSWMVDILQEGHSLRPALQRRHKAHLRVLSWGTRETK